MARSEFVTLTAVIALPPMWSLHSKPVHSCALQQSCECAHNTSRGRRENYSFTAFFRIVGAGTSVISLSLETDRASSQRRRVLHQSSPNPTENYSTGSESDRGDPLAAWGRHNKNWRRLNAVQTASTFSIAVGSVLRNINGAPSANVGGGLTRVMLTGRTGVDVSVREYEVYP